MHAVIPKVLFSGFETAPVRPSEAQGGGRRLDSVDLHLSADNVHWGYYAPSCSNPSLLLIRVPRLLSRWLPTMLAMILT